MCDLGILLHDQLLMSLHIVITTIVCLSMSVLGTEYIAALAGDPHKAHFLVALPALAKISLNRRRKSVRKFC